jgi:hypothetical protein
VSVYKPKVLGGMTVLQSERHQAIVISDGYMNALGNSNVAVTTFEYIPPLELWEAVGETVRGRSPCSSSEMSKRACTLEDVRASIP